MQAPPSTFVPAQFQQTHRASIPPFIEKARTLRKENKSKKRMFILVARRRDVFVPPKPTFAHTRLTELLALEMKLFSQ